MEKGQEVKLFQDVHAQTPSANPQYYGTNEWVLLPSDKANTENNDNLAEKSAAIGTSQQELQRS